MWPKFTRHSSNSVVCIEVRVCYLAIPSPTRPKFIKIVSCPDKTDSGLVIARAWAVLVWLLRLDQVILRSIIEARKPTHHDKVTAQGRKKIQIHRVPWSRSTTVASLTHRRSKIFLPGSNHRICGNAWKVRHSYRAHYLVLYWFPPWKPSRLGSSPLSFSSFSESLVCPTLIVVAFELRPRSATEYIAYNSDRAVQ